MSTLVQDVRYGVRMMLKSPVVTTVAMVSLALGIAANASMFAVLNSFLYEPLPYGDQDGLVLLREVRQGQGIEMSPGVSIPDYRDYVEAGRGIAGATAYTVERANLTGLDVPEQLGVVVGTPSLFDVLRVRPVLGRGFRPEEGAEGAGNVVVLEYGYWQRRFLGDRNVLGRTVTLDGSPYTIIGVMPEDFDMIPANVQAFRPSDFSAQAENRDARGYIAFGRLAQGATARQVENELAGVAARIAEEFPESNRGWELRVQSLRDFFPGPTDARLLKVLTLVTLFGLLIACANVANLLLGRAEVRQKEVAVRTALGAGRQRILRQLLTESVVLGVVAGGVGSVLSVWVVRWLRTAMPAEMPRALMPELNPEVLLATLAVSILAGVAFGMAPALHAVGGNLREALGQGSRGGTAGRRRKRLRNAFVVGEFAVALALLTGSGFLMEAFDRLANGDAGFDPAGLLTFQLSVLGDRYADNEQIAGYERDLVRVLGEIPGVRGVAVMSSLPRSRGNPSTRYTVDGRPEPEPTERPTAGFQVVSAAYFETMEIPLIQGRPLHDADRAGAPRVAVVSQAFVEREFPGQDPLGRQITVRGESRTIVGVVGNILQERIALAGDGGEAIYLPLEQYPLRNPSFALRIQGDPAEMAGDVRQAVWSVEPDQPITRLRTLQAHIDESLAGPEAISLFLRTMAVVALLLAAMGIYGVMAHTVTQQTREIGIRMALGAGRGRVVGMITRSGLTLAGVGMLLGVPLSYLMLGAVADTLDLFAMDVPLHYALGVTVALALVAVLATYLPARRASGVQPVVALQEE